MDENLNVYFKNTDCKASVGEGEQGTAQLIFRDPWQYFAKAKNERAGPHGLITGYKPSML